MHYGKSLSCRVSWPSVRLAPSRLSISDRAASSSTGRISDLSAPLDSSGLFDITGSGINPHYFPGSQNHVLDRGEFRYIDNVSGDGQTIQGSITALSNPHLAAQLGDGDPRTFWEPAAEDLSREGLSNWKIEINLGRAVWADSIVVVFPPRLESEDLGDPIKLLVVEASMGESGGGAESYRFTLVGKTTEKGDLRRHVFPLEPLGPADFDLDGAPDIVGSFVHLIRLTALDSDFDQKELLGQGAAGRRQYYEALGPQRRGRRVFQRVNAGNFLKPIREVVTSEGDTLSPEQIYSSLSPEEQGPILYFKREWPRIAEIQVWGPGPNLAYLPERRAGGSFEDGGKGSPQKSTDGVFLTRWNGGAWDITNSSNHSGRTDRACCTMWIDLGASFWIDRLFLGSELIVHTTWSGWLEGVIRGYDILGSDGTAVAPLSMRRAEDFPQLEFGLSWSDLIVDERHRDNRIAQAGIIQERFSRRRLRFFQVRNRPPPPDLGWGFFNELQMYGEGYPAEVSIVSDPIILVPGASVDDVAGVDESRALLNIHWDGEAILQRIDPSTGERIERSEPLDLHPEVDLQIQTRTSDTVDSLLTYYEVIGAGTQSERRQEVDVSVYESQKALWDEYYAWDALPETKTLPLRPHQTGRDDDGDEQVDEDLIDGMDNDGDWLIDEDGRTGDEGGPNHQGTITLLKHQRTRDDDGDGVADEDEIDGKDNDGDWLIDEDGKHKRPPPSWPDLVATPYFAGWSPWSEPYRPTDGQNRAQILSPNPRKFLQIRVNIVSEEPQATARLRSLRVELAPPISADAVGELAILTDRGRARSVRDLEPVSLDYARPEAIPPLDEQTFSFFIRAAGPDPRAVAAADGFDELLLTTPFPTRLIGVRMGQVEMRESGDDRSLAPLRADVTRFTRSFALAGDGRWEDEEGRQLQVQAGSDSLRLLFPASVNRDLNGALHALIEVQFATQTIRAGTKYLAFLSSTRSVVPFFQQVDVDDGDATELIDSGTAVPVPLFSDEIIADVRVDPFVSPNGDGINDELQIDFILMRLLEDRPLEVGIYDLAGRRVARARSQDRIKRAQSGAVQFTWDGRDETGALLPPGLYLCGIEVRVDEGTTRVVRLVHVVY